MTAALQCEVGRVVEPIDQLNDYTSGTDGMTDTSLFIFGNDQDTFVLWIGAKERNKEHEKALAVHAEVLGTSEATNTQLQPFGGEFSVLYHMGGVLVCVRYIDHGKSVAKASGPDSSCNSLCVSCKTRVLSTSVAALVGLKNNFARSEVQTGRVVADCHAPAIGTRPRNQ